jgi:hypothetical protein
MRDYDVTRKKLPGVSVSGRPDMKEGGEFARRAPDQRHKIMAPRSIG